MTGNESSEKIHFLLLGHSREHILTTIEHFTPKAVVLFTTMDLFEEHTGFISELENGEIRVLEMVPLSPFTEDALESMTREILAVYEKYAAKGCNIIMGLTGGTNLMVVSMALAALQKGCPVHYCVNDDSRTILNIDTLLRLSPSVNHQEFARILTRGNRHE